MLRISFMWFIFSLQRIKLHIFRYRQSTAHAITIIHVYQMNCMKEIKPSYLGWWPFMQGSEPQLLLHGPMLRIKCPIFLPRSAPCLAQSIPFFPTPSMQTCERLTYNSGQHAELFFKWAHLSFFLHKKTKTRKEKQRGKKKHKMFMRG
jgi:hypothetical protein